MKKQIHQGSGYKIPQNLIQLIEWIRLGRRHFINELFLQYIDINSLLSLCSISKHYYQKYMSYSINFYFVNHTPLRNVFKLQKIFDAKQQKNVLTFVVKANWCPPSAKHCRDANTHLQLYQTNKRFRYLMDNYYMNLD